jgi:Na+/H+ antiporter NhaD/arsenite permease-like protein
MNAAIEPVRLSLVPFVTMLLCIALLPSILKHHWEKNYHRIALILAAIAAGYYIFGLRHPERMLHAARDYFGFIAVVGSLFVIAGGIHIEIRGEAKPLRNCLFLAVGGILGNAFGTTGASMLMIKPWIRMNKFRYTGLHTAFFIFVIGNLGGGLLPLGPPLLLGYLKGVPFFWVLAHCWPAWTMSIFVLLAIFYFIDRHNYRRVPREVRQAVTEEMGIQVTGLRNLIFLVIVLAAVFIQGPPLLREAIMIACAAISFYSTPKELHEANDFSLRPLREVAWLFLGIFFTLVPVVDFMRFHASKFPIDSPLKFYWLSGGLSSVLDNAPTYLTFLANAMGQQNLSLENAADVQLFLTSGRLELAAISLGSVLFGAATYIGNSPNFMIKAITEREAVHAPSFFGLIFKFALPVLLPVLYLVGCLNFQH